MVIMQAMASEKPVVSTDAGGVRYLVEDGKTGYIVPTGNVDKLAQSLLKVLANEGRSREMGVKAKKLAVSRFSAHEVARQTHEVYRSILA